MINNNIIVPHTPIKIIIDQHISCTTKNDQISNTYIIIHKRITHSITNCNSTLTIMYFKKRIIQPDQY